MTSNRGVRGGSQDTKRELLDIAVKLVVNNGLPAGFNIKLSEVVRTAGRTLGSAYQVWENQEAFRRDLAVYLAKTVTYAEPQVVADLVEQSIGRGDTIEEIISAAGKQYFRSFSTSPEFFVSLHFWTVFESLPEQVEEAVQSGYQRIQQSFEQLFTAVIDGAEREARAPFTLARITTMVTALTEGLTLRHRFAATDEERENLVQLYADSLVALLESCTQPAQV